jgi:hypothetical protein
MNIEYKKFASLNLDRRWHCSHFSSKDNIMLVHGGWNVTGPLGETLVFHLGNNLLQSSLLIRIESCKWEQLTLPDAPSPRRWHSLTQLAHRNQYLVYGGYNGDPHTPLKDFHLLDLGIIILLVVSNVNRKTKVDSSTYVWKHPHNAKSPYIDTFE